MSLELVFAKAKHQTLTEILRQAEIYLGAQLQAGIAADQRAMSFVSLMAAATAVIAGGGVVLLIGEKPFPLLDWACLGIAAGFIVAMVLAILLLGHVSSGLQEPCRKIGSMTLQATSRQRRRLLSNWLTTMRASVTTSTF